MKSLLELYQQHQGKVSDKWSLYLSEYNRLFSPYRDKPVRLLEIGIQNGGSLEIWSHYFSHATKLVGCDINPDCTKLVYKDPRIAVVVIDANTDKAESEILDHASDFDLIIDDGSHTSSDIVKSFARYFRHLKHGGLFVAEDLHCSYWREFEGGLYDPYSSIAFFKRLADIVNHEHWGVPVERTKLLAGFAEEFHIAFDEEALSDIHAIEFINSMCVIRKERADQNTLGSRFIAGNTELVVSGHNDVKDSYLASPDQHANPWTSLDKAPDEMWQSQSYALATAEKRIAELEDAIKELQSSNSWRITQPLRTVGYRARQLKHISGKASGWLRQHGVLGVARKAGRVIKREGLAGVRRRLVSHTRNNYAEWIRRYDTIDDSMRARILSRIADMQRPPLISVVMPTYNAKPQWLTEAIESVKKQLYPYWELCIADDASTDPAIRPLLERFAHEDARIKVVFREQNGHISAASNSALELATGEWVALLDHDDLLPAHALYCVADTSIKYPEAGVIYSDEDKVDETGNRFSPHFKSDWNPDLFFSQNYVSHLGVYRRSILEKIGGFRTGVEGSQDQDLLLRCLPYVTDDQIFHIPRVLYHWRAVEGSTALALSEKSYSTEAGIKSLRDYFASRKQAATIAAGLLPNTYRVRYAIPQPEPLVSLLIPTRDRRALTETCVRSILEKSTYTKYEIMILDNGSVDAETLEFFREIQREDLRVKVLRYDYPFNYSAINNFGVRHAKGSIIGLINNDIEVISPDWLTEMVSHVTRPEIGCVGAKLYYGNNTLQHGGVILGIGGIAGHSHKCFPRLNPGYFTRLLLPQALSAVTAACLLVRREIYDAVQGLDETNLKVAFNDVDFCLKVREAGYRNLWTPYAELYHHESISRGAEDTAEKQARFQKEVHFMLNKWGDVLEHDPYYSPNLAREYEDFSMAWPPRVEVVA